MRRKINNNEIFLKIGAGEFEITTQDNVRDLLLIQAYSQKQLGAIDIGTIRNEITKVMESGEAAFKLRKEKYGF